VALLFRDHVQRSHFSYQFVVELETFNRAERRVTEGRSYLRTIAADSTAGKVSDKTKDQTDMMKLMTDMQKKTIRFTKICQPA
jgi:pyridoxal biosynthesis lyase PdxS